MRPKEWQYDPGRKRVKAVEGQKKKPKDSERAEWLEKQGKSKRILGFSCFF